MALPDTPSLLQNLHLIQYLALNTMPFLNSASLIPSHSNADIERFPE